MFPDIYTSIQEGNTCYYFFDRSVGLKVNEGIYQILTSDVYLNYQYNQWGYNHCTIVNEGSNYMDTTIVRLLMKAAIICTIMLRKQRTVM